jgi:hypothetical protein
MSDGAPTFSRFTDGGWYKHNGRIKMSNHTSASTTFYTYKRILGIVFFVFSFLAIISLKTVKTYAYYETDFGRAVPKALNVSFTDNLTRGYEYEKKVYQFTTTTAGGFEIEFKNPRQNDSGDYWEVILYDSEYDRIDEFYIAGNREVTYSTVYGLPAGTYYIVVNSTGGYSVRSADYFTIRAIFFEASNWETEFNDKFTSADEINTNTTYCGTTYDGANYEKDYYIFNLNKPGYIRFSMTHSPKGNTNSVYKYTIYNVEYDIIYSDYTKGNYGYFASPNIGLGAGSYYVKICSANDYSAVSTDTYEFEVGYVANDNWEREFNDGFNSATPVFLEQSYSGSCLDGYKYDPDYYRFTVTSWGAYRIAVDTPKMGSASSYWKACLYNSSYGEMDSFSIQGNYSRTTRDYNLAPGTYYLCLQSYSAYSALSTANYSFKIGRKQSPSSLTVTKEKTKYYKGDSVSTSDIKVIAKFTDGSTQDVTAASIITNGVNTAITGTYKIAVSYEGKSATVTVRVVERSLQKGDKAAVKVGKTTFTYKLTDSGSVMLYTVSSGKNNLVKMTVPDTVKLKNKTYKVTAIGSNAFKNCYGMNSLTIGKNVKSIGTSAFNGCKKLKVITVNTSKLTKNSVSGSLKGSYVKTVKTARSNVSRYKKIFTKSNTKSRNKLSVKKK